jgi:hypothetical protein
MVSQLVVSRKRCQKAFTISNGIQQAGLAKMIAKMTELELNMTYDCPKANHKWKDERG